MGQVLHAGPWLYLILQNAPYQNQHKHKVSELTVPKRTALNALHPWRLSQYDMLCEWRSRKQISVEVNGGGAGSGLRERSIDGEAETLRAESQWGLAPPPFAAQPRLPSAAATRHRSLKVAAARRRGRRADISYTEHGRVWLVCGWRKHDLLHEVYAGQQPSPRVTDTVTVVVFGLCEPPTTF